MKSLFKYIFLLFPVFSPFLLSGQEITFKEKKTFSSQTTYIFEGKFSPFRNYFALTYGDNRIEVYDKNWRKVFESQGNPKAVAGRVSFSPDEEYLAFSKYRSTQDIAILRLSDLKIVEVLTGNSDRVNTLSWSHDGRFLGCGGQDYGVKVWSRESGRLIKTTDINHYYGPVRQVVFSFNDEIFAWAGDDPKIMLAKKTGNHFVLYDSIYNGKGYIDDIAFHPLRMELASASSRGLKIWRMNKNHFTLQDSVKKEPGGNSDICYTPTGDYLAGTRYNDIRIWESRDNHYLDNYRIYRHGDVVFNVSFSDDGMYLTSTSSDRSAIVWEVRGIKPSARSVVSSYLYNDLASAQKQILTTGVVEDILHRIDPALTRAKDEFETTAAYNLRREKLAHTTLGYLQKYLEKKYHVQSAPKNMVRIQLQALVGYNADKEIYKIRFMDTEAGVKIPIEAAKQLKSNWKKAYIQAWKHQEKGNPAYTYADFELVHPAGNIPYPVTPLENPFQLRNHTVSPSGRSQEVPIAKTSSSTTTPGVRVTRALLFATNVYDSFSELVNPILDARSLKAELTDNYGSVVELVENPTLDETIRKIREYARIRYGEEDQLFIFFAGHGVYDPVFKEGYIISKDSKPDDETKTSFLSHSNLRTMVNNIPCNHIFLAMDVCFGGTFDPLIASVSRAANMYEDVSPEAFIERKSKYKTRLYLTSGGKEYVPDGRPGHHSPFMRKFLEALRSYGGKDGILTVTEILPYIEKVNPQPRFGEFGNNEPGSDFLFLVKH